MTHREALTTTVWPYVVTRHDQSYEEIAQRYGQTYASVAAVNRGLPQDSSAQHTPTVSASINIPIALEDLDYEWERYPVVANTTLGAVCRERNGTPGRGAPMTTAAGQGNRHPPQLQLGSRSAPTLTPQYLWRHLLNNHYRRAYLEANASRFSGGVTAEVNDSELDQLSLSTDSHLWIPWPTRAIGRPVNVAPQSTTGSGPASHPASGAPAQCTSCAGVPDWVDELYIDFIVPMGQRVEQLRIDNRSFQTELRSYHRALGNLHVVELLIRAMGQSSSPPANLDALVNPLGQLLRDFTNTLSHWPGRSGLRGLQRTEYVIMGHRSTDREILARYLLRRLQHSRFEQLARRAFTEADIVVNERESVRQRLCGLLADVCAQVLLVASVETDAAPVIERALERIGSDRTATRPVRGRNALETVLSLGGSSVGLVANRQDRGLAAVTAMGNITTTLVGNLPGPPSLAGAVLQLQLNRDLHYVGPAIRGRSSHLPALSARRMEQLARMAQMDTHTLEQRIGAVRSQADANRLADEIGGRYQSGRGWCSALALISLMGLIQTARNPPADPFTQSPGAWAVWIAELGAGGANTLNGFVGMLVRYGEGGAWEPYATALGRFAAGVGVVTGIRDVILAFQAHGRAGTAEERREANGDCVLAVVQIGGSVMMFFGGPWTIAGAVIVTSVGLIQMARDAANQPHPDSRAAVIALLDQCARHHKITQVLGYNSNLRRRFTQFQQTVRTSTAFIAVYERSPRSPSTDCAARRFLAQQHVQSSIIDAFVTQVNTNQTITRIPLGVSM